MTKKAKYNLKCHSCDVDLICPKCEQPQKHGTAFSLWLREQKTLSSKNEPGFGYVSTNLDYVWNNYRENWLILIEEKIKNGNTDRTQKRIFAILDKALSFWSQASKYFLDKPIDYRGYYLIQFDNTGPENSKQIKINGEEHNELDLLYLLKRGKLVNIDMDKVLTELFKDKLVKELGITLGPLSQIHKRRINNANV